MDIVIVVVLGLIVAMWVCAISGLVSALRLPGYAWKAAGRSKQGTIIGLILSGGIGGAYYWLAIHRRVRDAQLHTAPPPKSDPWSNDHWTNDG